MSESEVLLCGLAESRCDTMKKAANWLRANNVEFQLQDFKKEPPSAEQLNDWISQVGWEELLNRRGTTWRKLDEAVKASIDQASAIELMLTNPSIIKRPVMLISAQVEVGFKADRYAELLL